MSHFNYTSATHYNWFEKKKLNILNWKLDAETLYCDNVGSKSKKKSSQILTKHRISDCSNI